MSETHTVRDPFLNKDVQVSSRLTDRLRGRYASGPTMANGEPEFGWREFQTPPVQHEAASELERVNALWIAETRENERLRDTQEQIAQAVEQSAFCYDGTCATRLVPSASGEAATRVVAEYIRSLVLTDAPPPLPSTPGRE